ncbi:response regulator [Microbulbifer thermotolerans]|uniref:Helix-turn-helix domain-containing protein n=1 Tax=Microbulbifer thermotolerans TaxID=252514 RepID=A0A143HIG9_MICTH|nr:response regulator [Microbulbifer thermotolerans]AMX01514.1 response regulator [Microbulbifer thermotolerans]MCX2778364.1 helix-turn-helix domain-containing protein [Microbulbifer thermotolerans]MCX2784520.1 helix-turn-helix domain-containing protein [Microbulbifer thermotolerans]MCX2796396.1 helix-turn-helix domain-containing protein [Microbulbifer thermotolerans]MCX2803198.1 helix-turn-helix domain-containing protein [Microbulbifer thermotolerans]
MNELHVLTTGEAAKYCGVNFRTVIRWIERGQLKAYKLPGRGDHRICVEDFVGFLRDNAMPIPSELAAASRKVLLLTDNPELTAAGRQALQEAGCDVEVAGDSFVAGALMAGSKPALMVIDACFVGAKGFQILDHLRSRSEYANVRVLVIASAEDRDQQRWLDAGADALADYPVARSELAAKVKLLLDV